MVSLHTVLRLTQLSVMMLFFHISKHLFCRLCFVRKFSVSTTPEMEIKETKIKPKGVIPPFM